MRLSKTRSNDLAVSKQMQHMTYDLGFIGAGNMAEAIARGVLRSGRITADRIIASNPGPARRQLFQSELGLKAVEHNREVAASSRILLLCVKPQKCKAVLEEIAAVMPTETLVVSIMAGISTSFIESMLGGNCRVVRTMPNTPILVGEGMVAIAPGSRCTAADLATARHLFDAAGSVIEVTEEQMDAVTAVSGSGPAYIFFLIEQMIAAGVDLGLSPEQAKTLANQTALGAARMLTASPHSAAELRRRVTSPNGTTHAAITLIESNGLPAIVANAMKAAAARSRELRQ